MSWITPEECFTLIQKPGLENNADNFFKAMERGMLTINDEYAIAYEILDMTKVKDEYLYALAFSFADREGHACYLGELFEIAEDLETIQSALEDIKKNYLGIILAELESNINFSKMDPIGDIDVSRVAVRKLLKSWPMSAKLYPELFNNQIIDIVFNKLLETT